MKVTVNWKRDGLVVWRPVKALLFADKKAFYLSLIHISEPTRPY